MHRRITTENAAKRIILIMKSKYSSIAAAPFSFFIVYMIEDYLEKVKEYDVNLIKIEGFSRETVSRVFCVWKNKKYVEKKMKKGLTNFENVVLCS